MGRLDKIGGLFVFMRVGDFFPILRAILNMRS